MLFEQVLSPISCEEFQSKTWLRNFLFVKGDPSKFSRLCSWKTVNNVLMHTTMEAPRIKIVRRGIPVSPASFVDSSEAGYPRIQDYKVRSLLRDGAMLVLNGAERIASPIAVLAEELRDLFKCQTFGDFHANWKAEPGFLSHWDPQEVFILQIAGRKHWKVYKAELEHPIVGHPEFNVSPRQPPAFDGVIEAGDLLYIPRGWWHVATPLDEPTLHLTIGVRPQSGADLMRFMCTTVETEAVMRANIPFHDATAFNSFKDSFKAAIVRAVEETSIDDFREMQSQRFAPPLFALPKL